jgi:hypothetical protein
MKKTAKGAKYPELKRRFFSFFLKEIPGKINLIHQGQLPGKVLQLAPLKLQISNSRRCGGGRYGNCPPAGKTGC